MSGILYIGQEESDFDFRGRKGYIQSMVPHNPVQWNLYKKHTLHGRSKVLKWISHYPGRNFRKAFRQKEQSDCRIPGQVG